MRLITTCIFLAGILVTGHRDASFTIDLTGRLRRYYPEDTMMNIDQIPVFVRTKERTLAKSMSEKKGVFHLWWNDGNEKPYKPYYFYAILKNDTFMLATIQSFESDTPDLTFTLPTYLQVMLQTKQQ